MLLNKPFSFLISLLTLSPITLLAFTNAVYGYGVGTLVSCRSTYTRGGMMIWVGIYRYRGEEYQFVFDEYCPPTIEVDTY